MTGYVDNWQDRKSLGECSFHMMMSETASDVTFQIGDSKVHAHKYILVSRSCVFSAMLCGPLAETGTIKLTDVSCEELKSFLKYLYTDHTELNQDNVTAVLYLAKKYAVSGLQNICLQYLEKCLGPETVCIILEQSHSFDEKHLYNKAFNAILQNADRLDELPGFRDLCPECFLKVISAPEVKVMPQKCFTASLAWSVSECWRQDLSATPENKRRVLDDRLYEIYFPDMDNDFFVKNVVPSKILTGEELVKILCFRLSPKLKVDIGPFKTKFVINDAPQTRTSEPVHSKSVVDTTETCIYSNFKKVPQTVSDDVYDGVFIKSRENAYLHGFKLLGSGLQHIFPHRYVLKILLYSNGMGRLVFDGELTAQNTSDMNGMSTAHLTRPFLLNAHFRYQIKVRMIKSGFPLYQGRGLLSRADEFVLENGDASFRILAGFVTSVGPKEFTCPEMNVHL